MIDRDAGGEREELDPETVVSSSSDSLNFYKRCAWYVPFTMVADLANGISDLTNWKICQHLGIDSCNLFIQFRVVL